MDKLEEAVRHFVLDSLRERVLDAYGKKVGFETGDLVFVDLFFGEKKMIKTDARPTNPYS